MAGKLMYITSISASFILENTFVALSEVLLSLLHSTQGGDMIGYG